MISRQDDARVAHSMPPHADHHDHGAHGHSHGLPPRGSLNAAFVVGAALNTAFIVVEIAFGILGNSVALVADAGHNAGDVLGLFMAWGGLLLSRRQPGPRFTYGLRGSSILAALFNAVILLITVGGIIVESVRRLYHPEPVAGQIVMFVALAGMIVNGATALLFRRQHQGDLNVRGVFVHMLTDAVVSASVLVGGAAVLVTGRAWIDPLVGLGVAAFLVASTWQLLKQSVSMALQGVPADIDPAEVLSFIGATDGVTHVHDLHIWPISTTDRALTCHMVRPGGHPGDRVIADLARALEARFGICHATIQVEMEEITHDCRLASGQ